EKRLLAHNELATKGWTIRFRPWKLIYSKSFPTKADAMKHEKELKTAKGRTFIWSLVLSKP
ncbi:MAG TPA: GIY-YIG nuclease family protein, partial [Tenuifilaceae bacterium]|nr:GIY-YIG nuclease family protein [Tenuifilaceae bacterium]HRX69398.1 GIY-YIG nuclease family protein [Tenuifilaceae bacterium]